MYPELIQLGPLTLQSYGILLLLGVAAAYLTTTHLAGKRNIPPGILQRLVGVVLIGGVAGSRLLYVFMNSAEFSGNWHRAILPLQPDGTPGLSGLVFLGGVAGGVIAGILYVHYRRLPVWLVADSIAPGLAIGLSFGRIGCLLNGCCFGHTCDLPWAISFPPESPAAQMTGNLPLHPTQVYAAGYALVIALVLLAVDRRRPAPGILAALFLILYGIARFVIDFFRFQDPDMFVAAGLTISQFISVLMFLGGVLIIWRNRVMDTAAGLP